MWHSTSAKIRGLDENDDGERRRHDGTEKGDAESRNRLPLIFISRPYAKRLLIRFLLSSRDHTGITSDSSVQINDDKHGTNRKLKNDHSNFHYVKFNYLSPFFFFLKLHFFVIICKKLLPLYNIWYLFLRVKYTIYFLYFFAGNIFFVKPYCIYFFTLGTKVQFKMS